MVSSVVFLIFGAKAVYQINGGGGHKTLKVQSNCVFALTPFFFHWGSRAVGAVPLMEIMAGIAQVTLVPAVLAFSYRRPFGGPVTANDTYFLRL